MNNDRILSRLLCSYVRYTYSQSCSESCILTALPPESVSQPYILSSLKNRALPEIEAEPKPSDATDPDMIIRETASLNMGRGAYDTTGTPKPPPPPPKRR